MIVLLFSLFALCYGTFKDVDEHLTRQKRQIDIPDTSDAVFTPIDNKQDKATEVTTAPTWIAQVQPTVPLAVKGLVMCSAVCVKEHAFITASRCLVTLRVPYTAVLYQEAELGVKAFVRSSAITKQMYNDISFIITVSQASKTPLNWQPIQIANPSPPWSEEYEGTAKVIGYVADVATAPAARTEDTNKMPTYKLYELPVKTSTTVCGALLNQHYRVPCFFNCTVQEYTQSKLNCQSYLRGLGHAVVEQEEGKDEALLIGITTWAVIDEEPLPVGFAVTNDDAFLRNMDCAEIIAHDRSKTKDLPADYNGLCDTGTDPPVITQ